MIKPSRGSRETLPFRHRHLLALSSAPCHNRRITGPALSDYVALSVITVQEIWDGWEAVIARAKTPDAMASAYSRLTDTLNELKNWPIISFTAGAIKRYSVLKKQKLNVGSNDLKIAAIAAETGAIVVTRNGRDFKRIPDVIIEDWAV